MANQTYRALLEKLKHLSEEELDQEVVVFTPEEETYYYSVKLKANGDLTGPLEDGHLVLIAIGCEEGVTPAPHP